MNLTYRDIRENKEINQYITMGNEILGVLGYTDHSQKHAVIVAERAAELLEVLGYSKREIELCKIAGFMHDIRALKNFHFFLSGSFSFILFSNLYLGKS